MPIFEWDDNLLLGVPQIDADHRHLIELLNRTYDLKSECATKAQMTLIVTELMGYASDHFRREEVWMLENECPGLAQHKMEHDGFSQRILSLLHQIDEGKTAQADQLLSFLIKWLVRHIMGSDRSCLGADPVPRQVAC